MRSRRCDDDDYLTMTYRGHGHALRAGRLDGGVLRRADGPHDGLLQGRRRLDALHRRRQGPARRLRDRRRRAARRASAPPTRPSCRAPTASRSRSAATARPTSARSTRRSTWRPPGRSPVVFVVENNLYGEYTPAARVDADRRSRRAREGLRHPGRDRRRPGHRRGLRRGRRGRRARAGRRRPVAARDEDLPLPRALAHRSGEVPAGGRARRAGSSATRSRSSARSSPRQARSPRMRRRRSARRSSSSSTRPPTAPSRRRCPTIEEIRSYVYAG